MLGRLGAFFLDILQVLVFAVSIFLFVYLLVLQPHKIKGNSMDPNFHDGEFLLTDKISYRFGIPKRGDVIVFKAPPDGESEFIKRILGLPGEKVMIKDNHVYINGNQVHEAYLDTTLETRPGTFAGEGVELVVPTDEFFVMGDNRNHSFDSRNFGFIGKDKIIGKAWFLYWPVQNIGTVPSVSY